MAYVLVTIQSSMLNNITIKGGKRRGGVHQLIPSPQVGHNPELRAQQQGNSAGPNAKFNVGRGQAIPIREEGNMLAL